VKIALIDGDVSTREPSTADPRHPRAARIDRRSWLEGVLNEIETRAAVEKAKLEQARGA
jgi:hypothetical protein